MRKHRPLDETIATIRAAEEVLRRRGVAHLSVFGSYARGEAGPESDLDVLVELDSRRQIDLLDLAGIAGVIENLVGVDVDIALADRLRPHVAESALREAVRVF